MSGIVPLLESIAGAGNVVSDPDELPSYGTDWLGRSSTLPLAAVLPDTPLLARELVEALNREGVAVCPQGGNTGLVGGGVPHREAVVLSTKRLSGHLSFDDSDATLFCDAGTTVEEAQAEALSRKLEFPIDLASRGSATIGGIVATNAGGLRVVRYGHTRKNILGVSAVMPDGSVFDRTQGLRKDTAGYDLSQLLCGSEGTLGLVTSARFQLHRALPFTVTAVLGMNDVEEAVKIVGSIQRLPGLELAAAEFMTGKGVAFCRELFAVTSPIPETMPVHLLLECQAMDAGVLERFEKALGKGILASAVGIDAGERRGLWRVRERHPEIGGRLGHVLKLDLAFPLRRYAEALGRLEGAVRKADPKATSLLYGHLADGSVHLNVVTGPKREHAVRVAVFTLVASMEGTISAEHGIGFDKRDYLTYVRSEAEIGRYRSIKRAFDPDSRWNPDTLLPAEGA